LHNAIERHLQQGVAAFADGTHAVVGLVQLLLDEGELAVFGLLNATVMVPDSPS
jgi:hypothetical protein